jgi:hypothetical protein
VIVRLPPGAVNKAEAEAQLAPVVTLHGAGSGWVELKVSCRLAVNLTETGVPNANVADPIVTVSKKPVLSKLPVVSLTQEDPLPEACKFP